MPAPDTAGPRILIWGLALIAACWLAMAAAGAVAAGRSPALATALWPANGFAFEEKAVLDTFGGASDLRRVRVADQSVELARDALRREPLASSALTLIGLARGERGADGEAARIIAYAHAIDKRQLIANAWLINHHGTRGRVGEVLQLLDEALKIKPELRAQYMPALAQALANRETIPVFQWLLRGRPRWESGFWNAVSEHPPALPNAEVLRSRILAGAEDLGEIDDLLVGAFIRAGRLDLAESFAKNLPPLASDADSLVRNGSFSELPRLPPLDWELHSDGRIGAAFDEARGSLEINALPGAAGLVARQLVALAPGEYQLLVKSASAIQTRGAEIVLRLACAQPGAVPGAALTERMNGEIARPFEVPAAGCRYYWLAIEVSAIDAGTPSLTSLAEVRIVRARPRPLTAPTPGGVPETGPPETPTPIG